MTPSLGRADVPDGRDYLSLKVLWSRVRAGSGVKSVTDIHQVDFS